MKREAASWIETKSTAFLGFLTGAVIFSTIGLYVATYYFMDPGKFNSPLPNFLIAMVIAIPLTLVMATLFTLLVPKRSLQMAGRRRFVATFASGVLAVLLGVGAASVLGSRMASLTTTIVIALFVPCAVALGFALWGHGQLQD